MINAPTEVVPTATTTGAPSAPTICTTRATSALTANALKEKCPAEDGAANFYLALTEAETNN